MRETFPFHGVFETSKSKEKIEHDKNSYLYIENGKWRRELNRIINNPEAQDQERLFLVCFLKDQLNWNEIRIVEFLQFYNKWADFNLHVTTRNVNRIFEGKENGRLSGSKIKASNETKHAKANPTMRNFFKSETAPAVPQGKTENFPLVGFENRVSIERQEMEVNEIETIRVLAAIDNGNRWYKISEKQGQHGNFYSLDSGKILEVTMKDGSTGHGHSNADKFFSLPKQPEVLKVLVTGIQQLIPEQPKVTKK